MNSSEKQQKGSLKGKLNEPDAPLTTNANCLNYSDDGQVALHRLRSDASAKYRKKSKPSAKH